MEPDDNIPRNSPYPAADIPELLCCSVHVGFISPFRIVLRESDPPWEPTLTQINNNEHDYIRLSRLVGGVEVGLPTPFHMIIGVDGSLIVPALPMFEAPEHVVAFINRQLASILLGGLYCEANQSTDIETGVLLDFEFVRLSGSSDGRISHYHNTARLKCMSGQQNISLFRPTLVSYKEIYSAHVAGRALLSKMTLLTPEILLEGITAYARRDWNHALANLWIVIEQLTSQHWEEWIRKGAPNTFPARTKQFADTRTWTTALRQEVLFQAGTIDGQTLASLFVARQARNALVHKGKVPDAPALEDALRGLKGLMSPFANDGSVKLFDIDLKRHGQPTFEERCSEPAEPTAWRRIPLLPRETEITMRYRAQMQEIKEGKRPVSPPSG